MPKYLLPQIVALCFILIALGLTAYTNEPKILYREGPQHKYLLEARQTQLGVHALQEQGKPLWNEEPIGISDEIQGDLGPVHDPGPGFEMYTYYISTVLMDSEITPWQYVVWQWENDMTLQEQRVEVLKELAKNYAAATFDEERGRLLSLSFDYENNAKKFPDTGRRADFVPINDSLLIRLVEAFPELRILWIRNMEPDISDRGIEALPRLKYLRGLRIDSVSRYICNVSDAAMPHIAQCKNLMGLYMSNMHVTDRGIESLSSLKISHLSLGDLSLTPQCFISIAKMPNIRNLGFFAKYGVALHRVTYGQDVLDAIASLDGRLDSLHIPILNPDMLYAICQINSLRRLQVMLPQGILDDDPQYIYLHDLQGPPYSYSSLHQRLQYLVSRGGGVGTRDIDWKAFENYRPPSE